MQPCCALTLMHQPFVFTPAALLSVAYPPWALNSALLNVSLDKSAGHIQTLAAALWCESLHVRNKEWGAFLPEVNTGRWWSSSFSASVEMK